VRRGLMAPLASQLPHGARGRNFIHNVALDPAERYLDNVSTFNALAKRALYTADFRRSLAGREPAAELFRAYAARADEGVGRLLYLDSKTYLPGDILTKVDRMSMAVSLEARAPLLDHELIDFVTRIPSSLKLRGFETKHVLKRAVRDLVPPEILDRPKQGFGVPIEQWINRQLRDRVRGTLLEPRARQRGYFDARYLDLLFDEHERGRRNHSTQLWALFMLELWHRAFVDDGGALARARSEAVSEAALA
jgi:asparagine synthase (glutamine-hydrolysing)